MPKQDDDLEFGGENRAMNNLARAIREHADALLKLTCQLQAHNVTKADLNAAKDEIIKALGERVDAAAVAELKSTSAELMRAVKANTPTGNTPISGS